jgi:large subunit ribosomal protein L22
MEIKAAARFVRISPQKIRLVMGQVRGKNVEEALNLLSFAPQRGARILRKLINSAVANAQENAGMDVDSLYIAKLYADEGPTLKRWRPRALGRASRIRKRTSHLTVVLDEK